MYKQYLIWKYNFTSDIKIIKLNKQKYDSHIYMDIEKPIKISRNRKNKFTEKRNPYKKYLNAKWKWTDIFNEITNICHLKNFIKITAEKYNINYITLKHKYNNYKKDNINNINNENRGGSKRIINIEQEKSLYQYIKINYIDME